MQTSEVRTWDEIIIKFKELRYSSVPYQMTFVKCKLDINERKEVEKELKYNFDLWWNTWIQPLVDSVEVKVS